jgi:hypothetical protein
MILTVADQFRARLSRRQCKTVRAAGLHFEGTIRVIFAACNNESLGDGRNHRPVLAFRLENPATTRCPWQRESVNSFVTSSGYIGPDPGMAVGSFIDRCCASGRGGAKRPPGRAAGCAPWLPGLLTGLLPTGAPLTVTRVGSFYAQAPATPVPRARDLPFDGRGVESMHGVRAARSLRTVAHRNALRRSKWRSSLRCSSRARRARPSRHHPVRAGARR